MKFLKGYKCKRCNSKVNKDISNKQYFAFCPNCDEDMFGFEVLKTKEIKL